ncbi:hypothetical protein, partial [Pseudomonas viridiflava]|uniref:hypothetical protein n=1 Tax=Pseudomonas viridiflava TaxID=33069 RepID=UPI00197FEB22
MTWITPELVHASAPHSRADAERSGRHSHASVGTISVISSTPIMPMLAIIIKGLHQQAQHFWHVA